MSVNTNAIDTKDRMYELLYEGRLGNYPKRWSSLQEVLESGYKGLVSMRSKQTSNPVKLYHIPVEELKSTIEGKVPLEVRKSLVFSEAPPDDKRTIQGELQNDDLFYSFYPAPMRIALEEDGHQVKGLMTQSLLRTYLDPVDVEWLNELQQTYPGHVIEFTGFRVRCGILNTRMVVWEVRNY